MSRRRPVPAGGAGPVTLTLFCDGSARRAHQRYRIARCTTWTQPYTVGVVRVEFVHDRDGERARDDRVRWIVDEGAWTTWPFHCPECGREKPLQADHLSELVRRLSLLGVSRVGLADLR